MEMMEEGWVATIVLSTTGQLSSVSGCGSSVWLSNIKQNCRDGDEQRLQRRLSELGQNAFSNRPWSNLPR